MRSFLCHPERSEGSLISCRKRFQRFLAALGMTGWLVVVTTRAADVSVTASVDQRRVAFGESLTYSITVTGATSGVNPFVPPVEGLQFEGPSVQTSVQIVNGQMSQASSLVYRVTPRRIGAFTIPAAEVDVGGKKFQTEPISITVTQAAPQAGATDQLFGRIVLETTTLYQGQTAPARVLLFARQNVPIRNVSGFQCQTDDLGFRYLPNLKQGTKTINSESFQVIAVEGAIAPIKTGKLSFGPCAARVQVAAPQQNRPRGPWDDSLFDSFFHRAQVREVTVTIDAIPVEVLPLPAEGRPAEFTGTVGQWRLEMTAKPTDLPVGEPITVNITISGTGNIETVPTPSLGALDGFKSYDPTTKTTKNELNTEGSREFQQVLVAKNTDVKAIPVVRLSFFDPGEGKYKTATAGPVPLSVQPSASGQTAIVAGSARAPAREKLGEDIVYLKSDRGPGPAEAALMSGPVFWTLNLAPVLALTGSVLWKRRRDKLQGDVAYARRRRAARQARRAVARAASAEDIHQALQAYLGDRLNVPAAGLTASIVDERQFPAPVAQRIRAVFEACDAARFAGAAADVAGLKQSLEQLIDELETTRL